VGRQRSGRGVGGLDGLGELVELGSSVGNMVVAGGCMVVAGGVLPEGCMARAEIQGIVFGVSAESMLSVVVTMTVVVKGKLE
jgi:hypothetical protein